jgi:MYXO-CTERM domain-containing protein
MQTTIKLLTATAATLAVTCVSAADVVAGWTFTTAIPGSTTGNEYVYGIADQGANATGSSIRGYHQTAATTWSSPAGNGSQFSFSANNWQQGDYFEARLSTLGFQDISISFDQTRSSTGPSAFLLFMSVDGGSNWTTLLSYSALQNGLAPNASWSSAGTRQSAYTISSAAAAAANKADVIFRMTCDVAPSSSGGTNRIDNVFIEGTAIPAPGAVALLGLAGLAGRRRRA